MINFGIIKIVPMKNKIAPNEMEWHEGNVKGFFGKEFLTLDNGSLKMVKVAPLAYYPEHIHPDKTEYAYVLKGNPHFQIGQEEFSSKPDEFFIFPTNVKHAIRNKSNDECVLLIGGIKNPKE